VRDHTELYVDQPWLSTMTSQHGLSTLEPMLGGYLPCKTSS